MNFPLKRRAEIGSGTFSPFAVMSCTLTLTSSRIPVSAFSAFSSSQLRLGNSAQRLRGTSALFAEWSPIPSLS